jgi:hypothetical protein
MKDEHLQNLFSSIESASTVADLQTVSQKFGITDGLKQKKKKYPTFFYQFANGIQNLQDTFDFELGLLKNENPTDLEKLLYAVS